MGSRASYVIKKDGQARAYGSHWRASSLMDDLLWGPDYATAAFEAQEQLEELEEIHGGDEGCALIDWDQRQLFWDFANCRLPVQQQLYNRMLSETWPGWTVALAANGNDDLLEYLGIDPDASTDADVHDDPEFDDDDEEQGYQDESYQLDHDLVFQPETVTDPIRDIEDLEPGNWLTIRDEDGTRRDYFGFLYELSDCFEAGPALIEHLQPLTALDSPPRELICLGGAVIDRREKVIWLWKDLPRKWYQTIIAKAWDGWSLKSLPGGWQAHLEATAREAPDLAGGQRQILGLTVDDLLSDSSIDPRQVMAKLAAIGHGVRNGCAGITLLVAVIGIGLSIMLDSTPIAIVAGVLFVVCFLLTSWLWRKTSLALAVLEDVSSSPNRDAPVPDGLDIEQKHEILNGVLERLGYPSIEQLEADGELPTDDDEEDYDDEDDEDYEDE